MAITFTRSPPLFGQHYNAKGTSNSSYIFWRDNILAPVVNELAEDAGYTGDAKALFGTIQYFTPIYNWVRNQKKQLGEFYAEHNHTGKESFDFSGHPGLMEARSKAFKNNRAMTKYNARERGYDDTGGGENDGSAPGVSEGIRAAEIAKANHNQKSGSSGERRGGKGKGKGKGKGTVHCTHDFTPCTNEEKSDELTLSTLVGSFGSGGGGSGDSGGAAGGTDDGGRDDGGGIDGAGAGGDWGDDCSAAGEAEYDVQSCLSEDAYEKANGASPALTRVGMRGPKPSTPEASTARAPAVKRDRGRKPGFDSNRVVGVLQQKAEVSMKCDESIAQDMSKIARSLTQHGAGTSSAPAAASSNGDGSATNMKTAEFLMKMKTDGCSKSDSVMDDLILKALGVN